MDTNKPRRYHPALVTLHWLIALLLLAQAAMGIAFHFELRWAPEHLARQIHLILGIPLFAAVIARIVVRFTTPKPAEATTGNRLLDFAGKATHALLYIVLVVMLVTAGLLAIQANILSEIVGIIPPHHGHFDKPLHMLIFLVLGALVTLHVAAALWHQFIRRDRLFSRMGFGRGRTQNAGEALR